VLYTLLQCNPSPTDVVGKRERARLREMQRQKKQKIEKILAAQNALIDADMVRH
jgi:SWI/SNF-related matrix-associated actin-dependent regulator of chromatin subfamily A member 5